MSHKYISLLSLTLSLTLTLLISFDYLAAWSTPPGNPPGGNIAAPLNTSATSQQKDGVLGVMSLNAAQYGASGGILRAENQVRANEYCDLDGQNCNTSASGGGDPVGSLAYMFGNNIPAGYLAANGQAVSRTTYAALFATIGTTYGAGDGVTTFNLPDVRGEFIRGVDDGRGVDSGRTLGSAQVGQNAAHGHSLSGTTNSAGLHRHTIPTRTRDQFDFTGGSNAYGQDTSTGSGPDLITDNAGTHTHNFSGSTNSSGGSETRPRNIALRAVIKY